jgi:hypothetical protein
VYDTIAFRFFSLETVVLYHFLHPILPCLRSQPAFILLLHFPGLWKWYMDARGAEAWFTSKVTFRQFCYLRIIQRGAEGNLRLSGVYPISHICSPVLCTYIEAPTAYPSRVSPLNPILPTILVSFLNHITPPQTMLHHRRVHQFLPIMQRGRLFARDHDFEGAALDNFGAVGGYCLVECDWRRGGGS